MTRRIAMWSGPRNISTAMMRSWENRADCQVIDEPLYASFLARTGVEHPGREAILCSQPTEWRAAVATLTAHSASPLVYQKHMAHHIADDAALDWMIGMQHAFLIRHPAAVLASYVKRRQQVTPHDLGFLQQLRLVRYVQDLLGQPVIIVRSDDVLRDPPGVLRSLCARLHVPFDEHMLAWPAGARQSDGVWASHWYDAVRKSTGFTPRPQHQPVIAPEHQPVLDALMPAWRALVAQIA